MDQETKLSQSQTDALNNLLKKDANAPVDVDAFVKAHLTKQQAAAFEKLLKNETLVKAMLATPQAKSMLEKLAGKADGK